jgi:hypothetical protein
MLVSEIHFTSKSYIRIPNYTVYDAQHPDGTAHGGTAVIIKSSIKHHLHGHFDEEYLQATIVAIEDSTAPSQLLPSTAPQTCHES